MPAFIFIAGYFTKNIKKEGYFLKLIFKLLIPYIIFQILFIAFNHLVFKMPINIELYNPYWIMWFLISLCCWHLLLPIFIKMPAPIVLAVIMGSLIGYLNIGFEFSLLRTFGFFPFFLVGYYVQKEHLNFLKTNRSRLFGVLSLTILFTYLYFKKLSLGWLWFSFPYQEFGFSGIEAGATRAIFYFILGFAVFSFLSLVPNKRTFFSNMGANTMYTYLLHGFIIKYCIAKMGYIQNPVHIENYFLVLIFAIMVTIVTSMQPIRILFIPIIEPLPFIKKMKVLLKREETSKK